MFKCILAWFVVLLGAAAFVGTALFWPHFVDWAVVNTGWSRNELMTGGIHTPLENVLLAIGLLDFALLMVACVLQAVVLINRANDQQKRLVAKASLCDEQASELAALERDYETQQGALRAALCERNQERAEKVLAQAEVKDLKGLIENTKLAAQPGWPGNALHIGAGGGCGVASPCIANKQTPQTIYAPSFKGYVNIGVPNSVRAAKVLWPNGEVTVYDAEKGAWPEKMKAGAPEPAAVGGMAPYRIKAEPLKVSDLRVGDEVVYFNRGSETRYGKFIPGCPNYGDASITIIDGLNSERVTVPGNKILGVLRRMGS